MTDVDLTLKRGVTLNASQLIVDVKAAINRELDGVELIAKDLRPRFKGGPAMAFNDVVEEIISSGQIIGGRLSQVSQLVKDAGDKMVFVEQEQEDLMRSSLKGGSSGGSTGVSVPAANSYTF